VRSIEPSHETTPDGAAAFCYRAERRKSAPSGWSRLALALPQPTDFTRHRETSCASTSVLH